MLKYLPHKKAQKHTKVVEESEKPVLSDEDEAFLQRIAEEGTPPPLPARRPPSPVPALDLPVSGESQGNDAQLVLYEAKETPLPEGPDTPNIRTPAALSEDEGQGKGKEKEHEATKMRKRKTKWSFIRRDSRASKRQSQKIAAGDLLSATEALKSSDAESNEDGSVSEHEAEKEEREMTNVLEQLNLAAVNNRVFSMSKESQELLRKCVSKMGASTTADRKT